MCAHAPHSHTEVSGCGCGVVTYTVSQYGLMSRRGRRRTSVVGVSVLMVMRGPRRQGRGRPCGLTPPVLDLLDPIAGRDARRVREDARVRCHAKSDASHVLRTSLPGLRYASRRRASGDDAWQPGEHPPRSLRCVRGCRTRLIIFRAAGGLSDAVGPHPGHATRGQHHAAPV